VNRGLLCRAKVTGEPAGTSLIDFAVPTDPSARWLVQEVNNSPDGDRQRIDKSKHVLFPSPA
jgi:hypothetical protein